MFNTGKLKFQWMSIIIGSVLAALIGSPSMADEPQETVTVRRQPGHTIQIFHSDGTTTKIPPTGQFLHESPNGMKLVTAAEAEATAKAEKENAQRSPSIAGTVIVPPAPEQTIENIYGDGRRETVKVSAKQSPSVTSEMHIVRRGPGQTVKILHHDGTTTTFAPPTEAAAEAEKENAKRSPSVTGEPQETVIVRKRREQIDIEKIYDDGRTTKIPSTPQFLVVLPDGTKLVTANPAAAAESVKEGAKRSPNITGEPQARIDVQRFVPPGQIITVLHTDGTAPLHVLNMSDVPKIFGGVLVVNKEYGLAVAEKDNVKGTAAVGEPQNEEPNETITVQRNLAQTIEVAKDYRLVEAEKDNGKGTATAGRFQISPAGDSAILVDTETGKSWLLYYPDKKIPSRLNEARGRTWKEMPCIWLPLHRPETDAEIEQILARERALREVSDKLRAEEQKNAEAEAKKRVEEFEKRSEAKTRASGGTRRNADGTPLEPKSE